MQRVLRYMILPLGWMVVASCTDNNTPTESPTGMDQAETADLAAAANSWTTKAPMPTGRLALAAAVVNNSLHQPILYAIGGIDVGRDIALDAVEAYNYSTNSWTSKAPMPTPLGSTNGAAVIGGKIYLSGGRNPDNHSPGSDDGFPRRSLFVYDPALNSWNRKADVPLPSAGGVTGVINGQLYVLLGGWNGVFYRYNPGTNTWSTRARCPIDHSGGAGAVINGKFFVAGGQQFNSDGPYSIRKLHVYDPITNSWTVKALLPNAVVGAAGVRLLGQLYAIGGLSGNFARRYVQAYDPVGNKWTVKAPLPTWLVGHVAVNVVIGGQQRITVIGGDGGTGDAVSLRANYLYTP